MRNTIIDNLRGICMLGVIAIHIGSLALTPNSFTLYVILEILSRYSVPAFFFISGYGLACTDKALIKGESSFSYSAFMKKRLQGAGLPYLSWSLFYQFYFWLILPAGYISWNPLHLAFVLFFGLGCYHLYFMVILLWFYCSYPIWRKLLQIINKHSIELGLALLFCFQLAFNWWTTHPGIDAANWNALAKNFFMYRLNYLPFHYLLIFMGGCLAALHWERFQDILRKNSLLIIALYIASIIYDVGSCYEAYIYKNYSLLDLANTYHQLSPQGLLFTITSILFFCLALDKLEEKAKTAGLWSKLLSSIALLSANSMLIYFVHPLILDWMTSFYNKFGIVMTVKKVSLSYVLLVIFSLGMSILLTKLFQRSKLLSLLFTGKAK